MSWVEEQSWFGLEDSALEYQEIQNEVERLFIKHHLWTTKDGRHIHISNMSQTHLTNAINKCLRENWRLYALPLLIFELNKRK